VQKRTEQPQASREAVVPINHDRIQSPSAAIRKKSVDFRSLLVRPTSSKYSPNMGHRSNPHTVIVDEYQDVNPIQEAIVWSLHELGARVCVVGDDDQTIYQWRGSDVQKILNFTRRYPAVDQIPLEENFRSSDGIVDWVWRSSSRNT
jgi:superfamily I DNA/RNA helicase